MENRKNITAKIDNNYFKWLYKYSKNNSSFDDSNDYSQKQTAENQKNISLVSDLYETIKNYADNQDISSIKLKNKFFTIESYYIKYLDKIYNVGVITEERIIFYCSKITEPNNINETIIDVENIITNNRKKVKKIKNLKEDKLFAKANTYKRKF